jgi:hypothetical protein
MEARGLELSPQQRLCFLRDGFLRLPAVFSAHAAAQCRSALWRELQERGVRRDPASWSHAKVRSRVVPCSAE